jgi:hypothetical protein
MDSIGLPLVFILDKLREDNCTVDWVDFIEYTIEKQWNITQTLSKIEEALIDNREEQKEVIKRLKLYLIKMCR